MQMADRRCFDLLGRTGAYGFLTGREKQSEREDRRAMKTIYSVVAGALTVAGLGLAGSAIAQEKEWPPEQMTMVISHDVGSSQNVTARAFGDIWAEKLGTTFVYDNRDGASGRVGYDYFLSQPKDGSVVLSSNLGSASIMYAQQKPDWDWREVLLPIGVFGVDPGAIFVAEDSELDTLQEVIDAAKEKPLTLGISFWASPENLQIHQIMDATGAQFEIIPNDSSGELVTQVLGGHVDVGYNKVASVTRGGEGLKIIAVPMAENPVPHMTDNAPTVDEVLGTETIGIASYRGMLVHKEWADANPEHLQKLNETFDETLKDPRFIEALEKLGIDKGLIVDMSTEEIYSQVLDRYWDAFEKFGQIYANQ